MRWLLLWLGVSACVSSNSVVCDDGRLCPANTVCDEIHAGCATPDQLAACKGKATGDACTVTDAPGTCQDGVCLSAGCGNGRLDGGEVCDDGNTADGDGCAADCMSNESCGNQIVDPSKGEQCDDGNHLDHDGCSSTCRTEVPHWIQHTQAPRTRTHARLAYDSDRDRFVMFGGGYPNGFVRNELAETLEFTGGGWARIDAPSAPTAREAAGLAYDLARHQTVLFGGYDGLLPTADTWLFDGSTWTAADVSGPSARLGMVMVYDAKRQRIVLFGGTGIGPNNTQISLADTWEWNGTTWTEVHPAHAPLLRTFAAGTYDPRRGVVVLAGGVDVTVGTHYADTWEFNGTDWTNVMPSGSVPQVTDAGMAYDMVAQRAVLYGGNNAAGTAQATMWGWNGTTWAIIAGAPSARSGLALAGGASHLVMFGGDTASTPNNETWLFGTTWTQPAALARWELAAVNDPIRGRAILFGGATDLSGTRNGETWEVSETGFALRASSPPSARAYSCMAYDYAHDNIVMFGGSLANFSQDQETWVWDSGWTKKTPTTVPSKRVLAACAWDGHHVIMMGGDNSSTALADAYSWDGSNWTSIPAPNSMHGREGAAAAYDPVRKQFVMFGGVAAGVPLDETWLYDGTTWTQVVTGFRPTARYQASLAWNPARQTLVLVGGFGSPFDATDSYEWDGTAWHAIAAVTTTPLHQDPAVISSLDGSGITLLGGVDITNPTGPTSDRWELRWDAPAAHDICTAADQDHDQLVGCADPDCWWVCAPLCPPGTTCDPAAPRCGDGICTPGRESCRTCAADCTTCAPVCGDAICDPGETCPGDCP